MEKRLKFAEAIEKGYRCKGDFITLGGAILDGETVPGLHIRLPLKTMNRHGLIAGATGTGKTKTLQVIAEQLSEKGVPVLVMDVKGDLSGIARPGTESPFIKSRHEQIDLPYSVKGSPVEMLTLSQQEGVRMRATVSEFGPVLLSRILDLNDTQSGVLAVIFKYCDDKMMPLLDLKDLKKVLQYITDEGKEEMEKEYGRVSTSTTGIILRKIIELEQQDADLFFGELSFDIRDLLRRNEKGEGYVNIIRLNDIQDKPKLFSTFMLCLLAEVYQEMPERGDSEKPELVIFIDEAHLIFNQASKALLEQIEIIVKLIRSKGIGVYFVTQNPMDVPNSVLSQLGLKIQHSLRAFTAADRKSIKLTAENFPLSDFYTTDEALTQLGIGEALVTALNEKGIPTPLAATMIRAPMSRMDILIPPEITEINSRSTLVPKYNSVVDRDSAYEMLTAKLEAAKTLSAEEAGKPTTPPQSTTRAPQTRNPQTIRTPKTTRAPRTTRRRTTINPVVKVLTSATFIRGVMGILKKVM